MALFNAIDLNCHESKQYCIYNPTTGHVPISSTNKDAIIDAYNDLKTNWQKRGYILGNMKVAISRVNDLNTESTLTLQ